MGLTFICQACHIEAPTRYAAYYQNIGAIVIRYHKHVKGNLCKKCHHRYFWKFTSTNLTLGWWGYISAVLTPCFVANNLYRYGSCITLPKVPPDARPPVATEQVITKLGRHKAELIKRINSNESFETVAPDLARRTGVTPGEVVMYVRWLRNQQKQKLSESEAQRFAAMPPDQSLAAEPITLEPIPLEPLPVLPGEN